MSILLNSISAYWLCSPSTLIKKINFWSHNLVYNFIKPRVSHQRILILYSRLLERKNVCVYASQLKLLHNVEFFLLAFNKRTHSCTVQTIGKQDIWKGKHLVKEIVFLYVFMSIKLTALSVIFSILTFYRVNQSCLI